MTLALFAAIIVGVLEDRFGIALALTGVCIGLVIDIIIVSRRHRLRVDRFGVRMRLRLLPTFPRAKYFKQIDVRPSLQIASCNYQHN